MRISDLTESVATSGDVDAVRCIVGRGPPDGRMVGRWAELLVVGSETA